MKAPNFKMGVLYQCDYRFSDESSKNFDGDNFINCKMKQAKYSISQTGGMAGVIKY